MATYVLLLNYTQGGIAEIKDSPQRLESSKKAWKTAGGEIKHWYLTMGEYDAIVIAEAPDDETAARMALAMGARGHVRTQTLRAFDEADYKKIIAAAP